MKFKKLITLILCFILLSSTLPVFASEIQKAMFIMDEVKISQVPYGGYSHSKQNAIDIVSENGKGYAPFDGHIIRIVESYNAIWFKSDNKVKYANGIEDYMTVVLMHDDKLNNLKLNQHIKQGEYFYDVGVKSPESNVTGAHIHLECIRGDVNTKGSWTRGNIYPYDALFLNCTTKQTKLKDTKWIVKDCEYCTTTINGKKVVGVCEKCHTEYDWLSKLERINGQATLENSNKNYKVTLYKKPYKDADKVVSGKTIRELPIIGTVVNAYGNTWYAVNYQDDENKACWTGYIFEDTLIKNYKISITQEAIKYDSANTVDVAHSHNYNYNNGMCYCGAVKASTQQTNAASTLKINLTKYPVQHTQGNNFGLRGTISSNYKIKKIYGYIKQNGNVIQSTEDSPNAKSVDVKDKKLNNNLVFETLGAGNYTLEVCAVDASGNSITVIKNFTIVGQTVKTESTLSINLDKYPVTLNAGSGYGLRGSITSNYSIVLVKGYVINSSGQTVLSSKDTPNSTSMDIRYANLNDDLVFNNLGAGNYTMKVVATDNSGRTVEVSKAFSVISSTGSNNSTLSINLVNYPVTLNVGSSYGLRGSITSNYNISVVRGYVISSNGQTVLSSKDTPNSTYMDIKPAHLNADLIFNNLSAGNYTMKVVAVDASGRTVEASKNFTVKSNVYVDNSPNGNGVTGTVAIPSSWENLSIRSGPSTNYQIVGSMNNGAKCTVYPNKTSNGWYYINYNGIWGYASGNQINLNNASASNTRTGIVNIPSSWTDLSIRTGPSTNYQIVGGMPQGARCTVYPDKASNGWYYVEYNGVSGYAAGNRINLQ